MAEKKVGLFERAVISIGEKLERVPMGPMCATPSLYEPELSADIIDELIAAE